MEKEFYMTQKEFIDKLSASLSGKVSSGTVQENISYYEQYFANEMRAGRSEEAICVSLGSPQLIAKGILEAERFGDDTDNSSYGSAVYDEMDYRSRGTKWSEGVRSFRIPGWLMLVIAMIIFFFLISLVLSVFSALAPIIIPVCIVLFIVHIFKNNF